MTREEVHLKTIGTIVALAVVVLLACERKSRSTPERAAGGADASVVGVPVQVEKVEIPEVRIRSGGATTVHVVWNTPPGTGVNEEAPFRVRWNRSDGLAEAPSDVKSTGSSVKDGFRVSVVPMPGAPNATLTGEINLVVCDVATHSICTPVRRSLELGFIPAKDATPEAKITIPLPQAKAQ